VASYVEWAVRFRVPLHFLLALLFFAFAQPEAKLLAAGALVVAAGLGVRAWAAGHLRRDTPVTVSGPYAHLRHPLYLGSAIILAGFAVVGGRLWLVVLLAAYFVLLFVPVMRREERKRRALSRAGYDLYATQVPAFWPRLRRAQRQPGGEGEPGPRFDFQLYLRHREWRAALGCAALLVVLGIRMMWG